LRSDRRRSDEQCSNEHDEISHDLRFSVRVGT
jgi:hypothetical protein